MGGGIIELIANKIINYGKIQANGMSDGSGGSIKIQCKTFINKGKIQARNDGKGGDGRIAIFCEEFTSVENEYHHEHQYMIKGIYPKPFIKKRKYEQTTQFTLFSQIS